MAEHSARHTSLLSEPIAFIGRHVVATVALAAVALLGVVGASASTLGGLQTPDLGASAGTVSAHSSGISVSWGTRWASPAFVLDSITLTTTAAQPFVAGEQVKTSIVASSGAATCTVTSNVAATATSIVLARTTIETACGTTAIAYSAIDRIAVVASGAVAP